MVALGFEVFLLLALSDICEYVFPVPASLGRAHVPHGLSWELVRGEDAALYSRGAQLAWERGSCLRPPLLWFPEGGPVRFHLLGWAGCVSWVAGKCYSARFGLCVTLDLSALLVEQKTEMILQNKLLECYV